MSARLRTSRSSAARASAVLVLDDAKELLGGVDDGVGLLRLESFAVVDPSPRHRDGEHARCLSGADVEWRVADVGSVRGLGVQALGGEQEGSGVGLVPLRL